MPTLLRHIMDRCATCSPSPECAPRTARSRSIVHLYHSTPLVAYPLVFAGLALRGTSTSVTEN